MKVYKVKVFDKTLLPEETPREYESYIAVGEAYELEHFDRYLPPDFDDTDIHYYFGEGEHDFSVGNTISTEEFNYTILERS